MPLLLRAAVDDYGHTRALLDRSLLSPTLRLTFETVRPISRAFGPMVAQGAFDVSEMAIATFLQAHALGKPLVLLPVVLMNRFHHASIVRATGSPIRGPADLAGRRVGVRAYPQTTAVWVRAILQHEYGVDPGAIEWVVREPGHVAELADPPNVTQLAEADFPRLLREGAIDAWIAGRDADGVAGVEPLIADADGAARTAFTRDGILPINHALVVRRDVLDAHPRVGAELVALFGAAKALHFERLRAQGARDATEAFQLDLLRQGVDPLPSGIEALRPALAAMIRLVTEQRLVPVSATVDALFAPFRQAAQREPAGAAPISAPEREA
ncbi:MAG: ABC transporter substrate-binding protein [Vulcanimicrobiaceae bacterium]|jgi:4,5-dihydroxyphthalate decarboxylase